MKTIFTESGSRHDFNRTVERFIELAKADGWGHLATHDLQKSLKGDGQDVLPVKVVEVCKPHYSGQLLGEDRYRLYSPFMPCRISIYETSDGGVRIARMDVAKLSSEIGGRVEEVMTEAYEAIEKIIKSL